MNEAKLRVRVKQIRENEPAFFEELVYLKEKYAEMRKGWLDKRIEIKQRNMATGKLTKVVWTVEDALHFLYETAQDQLYGDGDAVLA